jgi:hypothetical protein
VRLEASRLAGTGRIADDLWLIAHHEVTGRPHLSRRAIGVGMAGGLLAELLAVEVPAVTVHRGYVLPLRNRNGTLVAMSVRPDEPVAAHVLDAIVSEPTPLPARDWLLYLGKTAAASVAGRLERSGYVARLRWRLVPVNADWSHCALLRAHRALDPARTLTSCSALLAGLVLACGLGFRFSGFPGAPGRAAEEAAAALSGPLRELIAQVQLTSDQAVLSARK